MTASVIIAVRNKQASLPKAVYSLLRSQRSDLELIVVDDCSTDATYQSISQITDPRLRVLRNPVRLGPAASRNQGLRAAVGEFVFFTDADCVVHPTWLEEGLKAFTAPGVIGVEGAILYPEVPRFLRYKVPVNPFYHGQSLVVNRPRSDFASGNIAYRRRVLISLNGFDAQQFADGREDTDLGWRALKRGQIVFNPEMKVTHELEEWSWLSLIRSARRYEKDVFFYRVHGFFFFKWGPLFHPKLFVFPLLIWKYRRMGWKDLGLLPAFVCFVFLARAYLWKGTFSRLRRNVTCPDLSMSPNLAEAK